MDFKPIITYAGDFPLFRSLENHIVSAIAQDTCEWKRSYGRPIKNVRIDATFQPYDVAIFENYKNGVWSILNHPVLHIYVTECNDVDSYKSTVKDEINSWLKTLQSFEITDWMILIVETLDVRKTKNILPRTTVLDKIRIDFASKSCDRCISLLNPMKFEQKATESFRCVLQRIRFLMLMGYNKNIVRYEELIRATREKRNSDNWCFIHYFTLQEELAFVLEMLGLYMEALVQYDELDAMFSQFILNSVFGDKQKWLEHFHKPFASFQGITMIKADMMKTREKIVDKSATLLEFRSYLFERQALLLIAAGRQWEIAERLLGFLFGTLREIEALGIEKPEGSVACWEFICALEVLQICEAVQDSNDIHKCFQYSAPIWNLAKDKLYELGQLCGLLPGFTPTSEQLHIVVNLSAGIGDYSSEPVKSENNLKSHSSIIKLNQPPTQKLKEALASNQAFQKLYLELSELAISTYKHVSRLRSARLVGLELGNFYCTLNEPHKAIVFFTDLLRELKSENWKYLASQTLLELASCYKKMDDLPNYTKTCATISCCAELETLVRTFYFDELLKSLKILKTLQTEPINYYTATLENHFQVDGILIENELPIVQDNLIVVELKIDSNFPRELIAENISISYEPTIKGHVVSESQDFIQRSMLPITLQLDYKQDNTLGCASVECNLKEAKHSVRRSSSTKRKVSPTVRSDFSNSVTIETVSIKPGTNVFSLKSKATRVGIWSFKQISIKIQTLDFLSETVPNTFKTMQFEVTTKPSTVVLDFMNLVAGLEQSIKLHVSGGSFIFPKESAINLRCSKNLRLKEDREGEEFRRELKIDLSNFKSFETKTFNLKGFCELPGRRDEKRIEHKVSLQCPWSRNEIQSPLHFLPAVIASCRLHSSGTRKFLQVVIKGVYEHKLVLYDPVMKCTSKGVTLQDINPKSQNGVVIYKNLIVSFLWDIQVEPLKTENELPTVQIEFAMQYSEYESSIRRDYSCTFDVSDYNTLFKIHAKVEPSELCRVGAVCHLTLKITKIQENPFNDLMYEVLTDQTTWAICGRTAGVVSMQDIEHQQITLEILPLSAGFLPLPSIRLSKYISADKSKSEIHPKLQPFPPGQVFNSTKSMQIHVLASNNLE